MKYKRRSKAWQGPNGQWHAEESVSPENAAVSFNYETVAGYGWSRKTKEAAQRAAHKDLVKRLQAIIDCMEESND